MGSSHHTNEGAHRDAGEVAVTEEPSFFGKVRVYVRFLAFLRPHRRKVVLLVLLALVGVPLGKAAPMVTKFLVDDVLLATGDSLENRARLLVLLLLLQGTLWLSGEYVRLVQEWMGTYFWTRLCIDLSRKVYGHMHRLSADFFLTRNVGEHMYRANSDITQQSTQGWMAKGGAVKLISDSIPSLLLNFYALIWAAVLLYMVSPFVMLAVLAYMIPYSWGFMYFFERLYRTSFRYQRTGQTMLSVLRDTLNGMKFLKSSGLVVRQERSVLGASVANLRQGALATFWHVMGRQAWITLVRQICDTGIWTYTTIQVLKGHMSIGEWAAIPMLVQSLRGPAENLTMYLLDLKLQTVPAVRILQTLDLRPTLIQARDAIRVRSPRGEIEVIDATFGYRADQPVLRDIRLSIRPGAKIGLVGPSGSGKSSLLNLLMRLYDPDKGQVLFDGVDVRALNLETMLDYFGVVPQSTFLFEGSMYDNIAFGYPDASEQQILRAAQLAGLGETIDGLPDGIQTYLGEGTMLSGGQKQRIGIARALVRDPLILVLDEATSSLDPKVESQILETLDDIAENRTVITVAHRLWAVRNCQEIFVLDEGRIVERGTHQELLSAGGEYASMWNSQLVLNEVEVAAS
jgi:ATP-binding cassette subfamily B protein